MSTSQESFARLLLVFKRQHRDMQETVEQSHTIMAQSRQIAEDTRRIHGEVAEAVTEARHSITLSKRLMEKGK
jgi:hypothetical protein